MRIYIAFYHFCWSWDLICMKERNKICYLIYNFVVDFYFVDTKIQKLNQTLQSFILRLKPSWGTEMSWWQRCVLILGSQGSYAYPTMCEELKKNFILLYIRLTSCRMVPKIDCIKAMVMVHQGDDGGWWTKSANRHAWTGQPKSRPAWLKPSFISRNHQFTKLKNKYKVRSHKRDWD